MMKTIAKNDKLANSLIILLSAIVFTAVIFMRKYKFPELFEGINTHIFPAISAILNSIVALLLVLGLIAVKQKKFNIHKSIMLSAVVFSVLFLVSYILYHISSEETKYGGEGIMKSIYYIILITHIFLAGIILPFILFATYRGLTGEYARHKKLTRWVWPLWFYVSVTGVIVYFMISPFYN